MQKHSSHSIKQMPRNKKSFGQAIFPLVLILTAVFGLIAATFAGASYLQSLLSSQRAFAEQAKQAAASGVDDALLRVARNGTWTDETGYVLDIDIDSNISTDVTVVATSNGKITSRQIVATSTVRGVTRSIQVDVTVSPNGATRVTSRKELTGN